MRNFPIIMLLLVFTISSEGQTLAKRWYGKHEEKFLVTRDSSNAEFSPFGMRSENCDLKKTGDSAFSLGLVSWKTEYLPDSIGDRTGRQRDERLVDWFPFRIVKLNADTLIIKYASTKRMDKQHFESFILPHEVVVYDCLVLYSYQKIFEIRHPVFISLDYEAGGYHVQVDSSGFVKYWFDQPNYSQVTPGKILEGRLTDLQFSELKYLFRDKEIQELPEYYGSARDGTRAYLTIRASPRDIFSYGSDKGDPDTVRWKFFKFLGNISEKLSAADK